MLKKRLIKKTVMTNTKKLFKPNLKNSSKMCLSVLENMVISLHQRFPIAAMLNLPLKSRFVSAFSRFSRIKNLAIGKFKKTVKNKGVQKCV